MVQRRSVLLSVLSQCVSLLQFVDLLLVELDARSRALRNDWSIMRESLLE